QFYIGHQGRPGVNSYYMVMHVRQLFWTPDGWPLVSCQRYATEEETAVEESELAGDWELIIYTYQVVPGYADEQVNPGFSDAQVITLEAGGTLSGNLSGSWSYTAPWLTMNYDGHTAQLRVERGRDWEKEVESTVLLTGLNEQHVTLWAKKLE
ncbi:MAG: hypothetical protein KDC54_08805, partial [Lewinella sp.]|nr:hypothetical protein [Lewinella sp.]